MRENTNNGRIVLIDISENTIPEAWEKAVLEVWDRGLFIPTHYDKSNDPESIEANVRIEVKHPFQEPRIHKNIPGGPEDLEIYRQEVLEGIHDHWLEPDKKGSTKWQYSYHERIFSFPIYDKNGKLLRINQVEQVIDMLTKPRRDGEIRWHDKAAQITTWRPGFDKGGGSPCLQRLFPRLVKDKDEKFYFNLTSYWRSRDLIRGWFENVYVITELQKIMTERIAERLEEEVELGSYVDVSDSLHIYGSLFTPNEAGKGGLTPYENFALEIRKMREKQSIENRVWRTDNLGFIFGTEFARWSLAADVDYNAKPEIEKPIVLEDKVVLADGTELMKGENYQLIREDGKLHDRYSLKL